MNEASELVVTKFREKKINIFFPYNRVGGAFRSTYEYANRLTAIGYDVRVYFPFLPLMEHHKVLSINGIRHLISGIVRSIVRGSRVHWFECKFSLSVIPRINQMFVRDADVSIANHWPVAAPVFRLPGSKGEKYFYIRDIEQWAPYFDLELKAFRLPMRRLVTTEFIRSYLENELGLGVSATIRNGFNAAGFLAPERDRTSECIVSMIYSTHPMKGMEDGINCLRQIKSRYSNIKVVLFGFNKEPDLDFDFEYVYRPVKERLRKVYSQTDIFLCPSIQEGWHNPPSEAMAAGCALVATKVGSVPYTVENGVTGFTVAPGDVSHMVDAIGRLVEDIDLREKVSKAGQASIQMLTWDEPVALLDKLFTEDSHDEQTAT